MVPPLTGVMSWEAVVLEYVWPVSPSIVTRRSGAPVLLAEAIHRFLPSADMLARAMPFGPPVYHQTMAPSESRMNGTALPLPRQYDVTMKPRFRAVAFITRNAETETAVVGAPVWMV